MCAENFTDERLETEKTMGKKARNKVNAIQEVLDYAKKRYFCEFPEEFAREMYKIGDGWIPTRQLIDAIILEWAEWRDYVTRDSFNGFVEYELKKMFTIKTTSTFGCPKFNEYIGNKSKVVRLPPSRMSTTIYKDGTMRVSK